MSGQLVLDSSAIVALLADAGPAGEWVAATAADAVLAAPSLGLFETDERLSRASRTCGATVRTPPPTN